MAAENTYGVNSQLVRPKLRSQITLKILATFIPCIHFTVSKKHRVCTTEEYSTVINC